ncbi:hypothetical protein GEOBC_01548 [Geobacteraceae bacterium]|nr:hypothetical protein GEOBC_01548 [Geobacteraceae bacterium]
MSDKTRWLLLLCAAQIFIMLVLINYSAVLPLLKSEWGIAFAIAGLGTLTGPLFMAWLRRCPESARMAGGRK